MIFCDSMNTIQRLIVSNILLTYPSVSDQSYIAIPHRIHVINSRLFHLLVLLIHRW